MEGCGRLKGLNGAVQAVIGSVKCTQLTMADQRGWRGSAGHNRQRQHVGDPLSTHQRVLMTDPYRR